MQTTSYHQEEYRVEDGQAVCLVDLSDVGKCFGVGMWSCPQITSNIQLSCMLLYSYWLSRSGISEFFQTLIILAFHLNCTKGRIINIPPIKCNALF